MRGSVESCNLSPPSNYDYKATETELQNKYGFKNLGEGGFGVVLGNEACAIKLIKDVKRCPELAKEKDIYQAIQERLNPGLFKARVPRFNLYGELNTFCHFNIEKIFSPLSGWGDVYDEDDQHGHGYVLSSQNGKYVLNDISRNQLLLVGKNSVYDIDRPGNLIHFYINHFDSSTKIKLDNNQGILLGRDYLEKYFTVQMIQEYIKEIGKLLSFLIFQVGILPTDIEVVLGSTNKENREVTPFIYDFNEASFFKSINDNVIARSLYNKNGRFYFPNNKNPYYSFFREGFLSYGSQSVLDEYNNLFQ